MTKHLKSKLYKNSMRFRVCILILGICLVIPQSFLAQAQGVISLAISPPILEVIIQPGKEYKSIFTVSNMGGKTTLTPKIVQFVPEGNFGNVILSEDPAPDWVKYKNDPFTLEEGYSQDFTVLISPPKDSEEIDHYISLVFETEKPSQITDSSISQYTAKIASNILISISKDGKPKKTAEIIEFSAPKIIDSLFGKISYLAKIKNTGNSFAKPIGKIIINKKDFLNLAPQNILSGKDRKINCIYQENLKKCEYDKQFLLGKYVSELEFNLDESPRIYKSETTTYAFPFSIVVPIIGIFILLLLIKKSKKIIVNKV